MRTIVSCVFLRERNISTDWFVTRFGAHARIELNALLKRLDESKDGDIVEMLVETLGLTYKVKKYYPDGTLESVTPYVRGQIHGVVTVYSKDGKVEIMDTFFGGEPHGLYKYYDEQGRLVEKGNRYRGKPHGLVQYHYYLPATIVTVREHYNLGVLSGTSTIVVGSRELIRILYRHNKICELKCWSPRMRFEFDEEGNMISMEISNVGGLQKMLEISGCVKTHPDPRTLWKEFDKLGLVELQP